MRPASLTLFLFLCAFSPALAQDDEENDKPAIPELVQCRAEWHVGDSMRYVLHRTKQSHSNGVLQSNSNKEHQLLVTVVDSTADGYRLRWQRQIPLPDVNSDELPPALQALVDSVAALQIYLRTDATGALLEVEDREQLVDRWIELIKAFMPQYIATMPEDQQEVMSHASAGLLEKRDLLTKELMEEINVFFVPYGTYVYDNGQPWSSPYEMPNVITSRTFPAVATYSLSSAEVVNYQIDIDVVVDSVEFAKETYKALKEMAQLGKGKKRLHQRDMPAMSLRQHYTYTLENERSWISRIAYTLRVDAQGTSSEQTLTYSTAIPAPSPRTEMEWSDHIEANPHDPDGYYQRAFIRGMRQDHAGSIEDLTMAMNMDSLEGDYPAARAYQHMKSDQNSEALADIDHAIALDSTKSLYFVTKADILTEVHDYPGAESAVRRAITMDPDHAGARMTAAILFNALYRYPEALVEQDHLVRLRPQSADAFGNRANIRFGFRTDEQDSLGMQDLRTALAIDPNDATTLHTIGNRMMEKQQNDSAAIYFTRIIDLEPNNMTAVHNRGYAYLQAGELAEAIVDFNEAIEMDADFAYVHNNLGWALHLQGKDEAALTSIERSIAMDPRNAYAHYNKGRVLSAMGRPAEACAAWDTAINAGFRVAFGDAVDEELQKHCGR